MRKSSAWRNVVSAGALVSLLAGCASLPTSGPTGAEVRSAARSDAAVPFAFVPVSTIADVPPVSPLPVPDLAQAPFQPTDQLGPGDVVSIAIYEVGVTLFGSANRSIASSAAGTGFDPASSAERLPPQRVDDQGFIKVPYVGRMAVAGMTATELQAVIQGELRGLSQNAQVLVSVQDSITNSVIIGGEVSRPGRLVLPTNRESLLDALTLVGGYRGNAKDAVVRVQRGDTGFQVRVSDLLDSPQVDVRVAPGDKITVISRPQSFSILGASRRVDEVVFPRSPLTLAQAVATAGGADPNQGDPRSIYVFRQVRGADGIDRPTIYEVNMMKPGSILLSQRFYMQDRDVLFVGNARSNQLAKFVQLLSQLFVPITTVRATITQ